MLIHRLNDSRSVLFLDYLIKIGEIPVSGKKSLGVMRQLAMQYRRVTPEPVFVLY